MIVEELASKLGLDLDAVSFTKGILLAEGLKDGLEGIAHVAKHAALELISFVTETAEQGSQLEEMSKRTGISTDRLQELQYAAKQTGSDIGVMLMGVRHLSIAAAEASQGNAALSGVFRKLGVSLKDGNGHLKSGEELLGDVAGAMSHMDNETERARIGQQLFSRTAQYLQPLLKSGESSLGELTERFRELQLSMSPEEIARAHEFQMEMTDFNLVMGRLKTSIGGAVLAPLTRLLRGTIAFVQEMRKAIRDHWDVYLERFKWALMGVGAVILAQMLPAFGAWIAQMAVVASWYVALGIQSLLFGGKALLASMLPILGWLALAAIIVLVGEDLYQFFTGGDSLIGRFISGPWAKLKWEFQDIWNTIKFYAAGFWDWLKGAAHQSVQWVVDKFHELVEAAKGLVTSLPGGKWVIEHAFGTGAQSPSAQAALGSAANPVSSNFQADITVHAPAGAAPGDVATQTVAAFDEWHSGVLQDTLNDSEEE